MPFASSLHVDCDPAAIHLPCVPAHDDPLPAYDDPLLSHDNSLLPSYDDSFEA